MTVVPQWVETKGDMSMVSLRPIYPTLHMSAFRISESEECLIVKDWSKIVNDRREAQPKIRRQIHLHALV